MLSTFDQSHKFFLKIPSLSANFGPARARLGALNSQEHMYKRHVYDQNHYAALRRLASAPPIRVESGSRTRESAAGACASAGKVPKLQSHANLSKYPPFLKTNLRLILNKTGGYKGT